MTFKSIRIYCIIPDRNIKFLLGICDKLWQIFTRLVESNQDYFFEVWNLWNNYIRLKIKWKTAPLIKYCWPTVNRQMPTKGLVSSTKNWKINASCYLAHFLCNALHSYGMKISYDVTWCTTSKYCLTFLPEFYSIRNSLGNIQLWEKFTCINWAS